MVLQATREKHETLDGYEQQNAPMLNDRYLKGCQEWHRMTMNRAYRQQASAAVPRARHTALGARKSVLATGLRKNFWHDETRKQLQDLFG
jgi:hypothetical protein